jgi:hypothetical protein
MRRRWELTMAEVDRLTARAPIEAGYMPLRVYIERFGTAGRCEPAHIDSPSTAPDACEASEPVLQAYAITLIEER